MDNIRSLYNAAVEGDSNRLITLLQQDPLILDRCQVRDTGFSSSPLHVSAKLGHLAFSTELLNRKPGMAEELDPITRSCPLHLASAKGHLEIVKALMAVCPNMCLSRDLEGRNPLHLAALNGRLDVLEELGREIPLAVREKVGDDGSSILHLCVKFSQLEALKVLGNGVCDVGTLNAKDTDGNSILHLAVSGKQLEIIQFLVTCPKLEKNTLNGNGMTALDIFAKGPKEANKVREIWGTLRRAKLLRAAAMQNDWEKHTAWLENIRSALIVVASLIATMAYQAGLNPPGGFWQDSQTSVSGLEPTHTVGTSVIARTLEFEYNVFMIMNTVGLVSSMSIILLLISGLPCRGFAVRVMMVFMWAAVTAMTASFLLSLYILTPKEDKNTKGWIILISILAWLILMLLLLLGHIIRSIVGSLKMAARFVRAMWMRSCCVDSIDHLDA